MGRQGGKGLLFGVGEPVLVQSTAVVRQVLEEGAAFLGGHGPGVRCVNVRGEFLRYDEEGVAHGELPDQRDIFVERPFHCGDACLGHPGARGEEDGGGVGGVQSDDRVGHGHGGHGPCGRGQQMSPTESDPALFVTDAVHRQPLGFRTAIRA